MEPQSEIKIGKYIHVGGITLILGEGFCKRCQPQIHWYDTQLYIYVGEMCLIPMNERNELFNGVQ